MNIEIANRLVEFRKKNGLSQEQLAEKIGVSRQAVSKWERSEASPDTDNLILLARLYNVSLDELLSTEDEIPMPEPEAESTQTEAQASGFENGDDQPNQSKNVSFKGGIHVEDGDDKVHIGPDGIHVEDKNGDSVHVGWDGVHVNGKSDTVNVSGKGVYVNGERVDVIHEHKKSILASFPYFILVVIAFLCLGFFMGAWWWAWLLFLTIPIFHGTVEAIRKRKLWKFPYEVLTVIVFLCLGLFYGWWHPGWVVFLTIPIFRWLCSIIKHNRKEKRGECCVKCECDGSEETFTTED